MHLMCIREHIHRELSIVRQLFVSLPLLAIWLCQGERPLPGNRWQTRIDAEDHEHDCKINRIVKLKTSRKKLFQMHPYLGNLLVVAAVQFTKWTRRLADSRVMSTITSSMVCGRAWFSGSFALKYAHNWRAFFNANFGSVAICLEWVENELLLSFRPKKCDGDRLSLPIQRHKSEHEWLLCCVFSRLWLQPPSA